MATVYRQTIGFGLGAIATLMATSAWANPLGVVDPASPTNLAKIDNPRQIENQISSIRQLRDVSPQDWSYEALRNLVENYGCIVGYPDGTYRGDRALTRNEFAAGLSACLQQLERRLLEARSTVQPAGNDYVENNNGSTEGLDSVMRRAFFHNTGRFYESTNISGQANQIFGWRTWPGSYFDNQITGDALVVETIFYDALNQQNGNQQIRTRDLNNPFDTSLTENPNYTRLGTGSPSRPAEGFFFP